ncbi:MAG: adenylosuccinate synthase [Verrucomicrobiales bacterium]|nr:adenylosuccinate synthase [Verrucomicrobiales bacterium]
MSNTIVIGAQWGDEGKGKIVDLLTEKSDVVVRPQGGNNAGHTVISEGVQYILHLIPSGILWPGKLCVIGNGVVMDPIALLKEIDGLIGQGIAVSPENLRISNRAHLVMPFHREMDAYREASRGDGKIGTTKRGIGPTYGDKIDRIGFRLHDLVGDPVSFIERLYARVAECNVLFESVGMEKLDAEATGGELLAAAERLAPYCADTVEILHREMKNGKSLLFEGAQGTYLDIDQGTYPYVTSSNTTSGGACTGSGVPPQKIDCVVGVTKAYTTRVGEGPFPTQNDTLADRFHKMGREFGATTGRKRRCGWLDLVLVRYAAMVNGFDELAITILDGLDDCAEIPICTHYELDGKTLHLPPASAKDFLRVKPVYEMMPGWQCDTTAVTRYEDLPANAQAYLARIEKETETPVSMVGVGPSRDQTIIR